MKRLDDMIIYLPINDDCRGSTASVCKKEDLPGSDISIALYVIRRIYGKNQTKCLVTEILARMISKLIDPQGGGDPLICPPGSFS
jgi:hypothetical protein